MHIQIINPDQIARLQGGHQYLYHIHIESLLSHRFFEQPGGADFGEPQGRNEGIVLARKAGGRFRHPGAGFRTSIQACQTQMCPAFIDEFEVCDDLAQGAFGLGVMFGA